MFGIMNKEQVAEILERTKSLYKVVDEMVISD